MKTLKLFLFITLFTTLSASAQFKSARLQAAGLTCAMCTKAIYQSLREIPFIESINSDIKNSEFVIQFRKGASVDPDILKKAVEDAGFSVAKLRLTANFDNVKIANDTHVKIEGRTYHFLNVGTQVLNGDKTIVMADRDFLLVKEFKKTAATSKMSCVQTGKAGACCAKEGLSENTRVYHVTI